MKYLYLTIVLGLVIVSAVFLVSAGDNDLLIVNILDVGQGDSILIQTPGHKKILIDGGPGSNVIAALEEELSWRERTIDLMILTHPHDDHVSGLNAVIDRYDVQEVLYTGVSHTAPAYLAWLKRLRSQNIKLRLVKFAQTIELDEGLKLEIIWPQADLAGQVLSNLNNTSIVAKLIYGDVSFLLTGDIEAEVEEDLMKRGIDLSAQVLKVGHHGSDTSSSKNFIMAVAPDYAIMSLGKDNKFNFPSLRVLRRYQRDNIKVLRTDEQGTISFLSNGKNVFYQP